MKPDWSNAPKNATHWAMDANGKAYWYSAKPSYNSFTGCWEVRGGSTNYCSEASVNPADSLQERPK